MLKRRYKEIDYVIRYPENFLSDEKYPLVFYIHGAGGRGRDISQISNHPIFSLTEKLSYEAIFVAPQCYSDSWFDIFEQLQDFIRSVMEEKYVDRSRIYLMGASMGGYTAWQLAMSHPEWFAALVPMCGGGMYWNAGRLKDMAIWAFHGSDDDTVLCEESRKMVERIQEAGGNAKFTIYEGAGHDAWTPTIQNPEVSEWLFSQKKG